MKNELLNKVITAMESYIPRHSNIFCCCFKIVNAVYKKGTSYETHIEKHLNYCTATVIYVL